MRLDPTLQKILDDVDNEIAIHRDRFNKAYERGDGRAIEASEARLRQIRNGRDQIVKVLEDLQATFNAARGDTDSDAANRQDS